LRVQVVAVVVLTTVALLVQVVLAVVAMVH
jgi:hypothetical protein